MKIFNKLWSALVRYRKTRPRIFHYRWNAACNKLWNAFYRQKLSVEMFERMEKRHKRLMRVCEEWCKKH
jgi:hypothetical protein